MFASGARHDAEQGKSRGSKVEGREWDRPRKSAFDKKSGLCRRATGPHAIFHGDAAVFIPAQRRVNDAVVLAHVAVDDGKVFFFDRAAFQNFSECAGGCGIFCNDDHAAGFAVEAIDEVRLN